MPPSLTVLVAEQLRRQIRYVARLRVMYHHMYYAVIIIFSCHEALPAHEGHVAVGASDSGHKVSACS
jgi:hypothetical protein